MVLHEKLINSELKYTELTSQKRDRDGYIIFKDKNTPEIPLQNYIYIKKGVSLDKTRKIIINEVDKAKKAKKDFIRFVFDPIDPFSGELPELSNFDYHCNQLLIMDLKDIEPEGMNKKCYIPNKLDYKELLKYYKTQNSFLEPKANLSHTKKWIDIRINNKDIESIMYTSKGEPIGSCDLYYNFNIAKLEDFEVAEEHRRQGIGNELLRSAISRAKAKGVEKLYLIAERNDWVSDYYRRKKFKLFMEFNSYTYFF